MNDDGQPKRPTRLINLRLGRRNYFPYRWSKHSPFARRTLPLSYTSLSGISSLIAFPSSAICEKWIWKEEK